MPDADGGELPQYVTAHNPAPAEALQISGWQPPSTCMPNFLLLREIRTPASKF